MNSAHNEMLKTILELKDSNLQMMQGLLKLHKKMIVPPKNANNSKISFHDLELGTCKICNKEQEVIGKDGYWILRNTDMLEWICHDCKSKHNIRSYPVACEWCKYDDVKWYQGHTYDCPRCKALGIKE